MSVLSGISSLNMNSPNIQQQLDQTNVSVRHLKPLDAAVMQHFQITEENFRKNENAYRTEYQKTINSGLGFAERGAQTNPDAFFDFSTFPIYDRVSASFSSFSNVFSNTLKENKANNDIGAGVLTGEDPKTLRNRAKQLEAQNKEQQWVDAAGYPFIYSIISGFTSSINNAYNNPKIVAEKTAETALLYGAGGSVIPGVGNLAALGIGTAVGLGWGFSNASRVSTIGALYNVVSKLKTKDGKLLSAEKARELALRLGSQASDLNDAISMISAGVATKGFIPAVATDATLGFLQGGIEVEGTRYYLEKENISPDEAILKRNPFAVGLEQAAMNIGGNLLPTAIIGTPATALQIKKFTQQRTQNSNKLTNNAVRANNNKKSLNEIGMRLNSPDNPITPTSIVRLDLDAPKQIREVVDKIKSAKDTDNLTSLDNPTEYLVNLDKINNLTKEELDLILPYVSRIPEVPTVAEVRKGTNYYFNGIDDINERTFIPTEEHLKSLEEVNEAIGLQKTKSMLSLGDTHETVSNILLNAYSSLAKKLGVKPMEVYNEAPVVVNIKSKKTNATRGALLVDNEERNILVLTPQAPVNVVIHEIGHSVLMMQSKIASNLRKAENLTVQQNAFLKDYTALVKQLGVKNIDDWFDNYLNNKRPDITKIHEKMASATEKFFSENIISFKNEKLQNELVDLTSMIKITMDSDSALATKYNPQIAEALGVLHYLEEADKFSDNYSVLDNNKNLEKLVNKDLLDNHNLRIKEKEKKLKVKFIQNQLKIRRNRVLKGKTLTGKAKEHYNKIIKEKENDIDYILSHYFSTGERSKSENYAEAPAFASKEHKLNASSVSSAITEGVEYKLLQERKMLTTTGDGIDLTDAMNFRGEQNPAKFIQNLLEQPKDLKEYAKNLALEQAYHFNQKIGALNHQLISDIALLKDHGDREFISQILRNKTGLDSKIYSVRAKRELQKETLDNILDPHKLSQNLTLKSQKTKAEIAGLLKEISPTKTFVDGIMDKVTANVMAMEKITQLSDVQKEAKNIHAYLSKLADRKANSKKFSTDNDTLLFLDKVRDYFNEGIISEDISQLAQKVFEKNNILMKSDEISNLLSSNRNKLTFTKAKQIYSIVKQLQFQKTGRKNEAGYSNLEAVYKAAVELAGNVSEFSKDISTPTVVNRSLNAISKAFGTLHSLLSLIAGGNPERLALYKYIEQPILKANSIVQSLSKEINLMLKEHVKRFLKLHKNPETEMLSINYEGIGDISYSEAMHFMQKYGDYDARERLQTHYQLNDLEDIDTVAQIIARHFDNETMDLLDTFRIIHNDFLKSHLDEEYSALTGEPVYSVAGIDYEVTLKDGTVRSVKGGYAPIKVKNTGNRDAIIMQFESQLPPNPYVKDRAEDLSADYRLETSFMSVNTYSFTSKIIDIAYRRAINDFNYLVRKNPDNPFYVALKDTFQEKGADLIMDKLTTFINRDINAKRTVSSFVDTMLSYYKRIILAYNPSVPLTQLSALPMIVSESTPLSLMTTLGKLFTNPRKLFSETLAESRYLRDRTHYTESNLIIKQHIDIPNFKRSEVKNFYDNYLTVGLKPISWFQGFVDVLLYNTIKEKYLSQGFDLADARIYAEAGVSRTQGASEPGLNAYVSVEGRAGYAPLQLFNIFALAMGNLLVDMGRNAQYLFKTTQRSEGTTKAFLKTAGTLSFQYFFRIAVPYIIYDITSKWLRGEDPDTNIYNTFITFLKSFTVGIPMVDIIMGTTKHGMNYTMHGVFNALHNLRKENYDHGADQLLKSIFGTSGHIIHDIVNWLLYDTKPNGFSWL